MTFQSFGETERLRLYGPESGVYGWLTPYLSRIAAHNPHIAARVLSLPRSDLHFIALVIALIGDKRDDADHLRAFARGLGVRTRKSLMMEFAPHAAPKLAELSHKLAGRPWRIASYQRLSRLYEEPHARKCLSHLQTITRWDLVKLARLPEPYRKLGVLRKINRRVDLPRTLFAIEIVRRVRTDLNDRQIIASLEKAEVRYIREWVEAHYERLPFPQAPSGALTDGNGGVLRPVVSGGELRQLARQFDNCSINFVWQAAAGTCHFYRYDQSGRPVACAQIKRVPGIGWAIEEIKSPHNKELDGRARARVLTLFAEIGVAASPQVTGPYAWFDLD